MNSVRPPKKKGRLGCVFSCTIVLLFSFSIKGKHPGLSGGAKKVQRGRRYVPPGPSLVLSVHKVLLLVFDRGQAGPATKDDMGLRTVERTGHTARQTAL